MAEDGFGSAVSPLRVFGAMLRYYRTRAALSQSDLGARVHFSGDLVSKIEMGQRIATEEFTTACDAVPELNTGGALTELRGLMHEAIKNRVLPGWFADWPRKEAQATTLRSFEMVVVPGLLQTEDYARALLTDRIGSGADDVDDKVAARMERQAVLDRDSPPELWVVMDEAVLHRRIGGPHVMREQINNLTVAARRPNIVIQVIPAAVGVHDGFPAAAGFVIADFAHAPRVAYQDTAVRGQIIEDANDIAVLMSIWDRLRAETLSRSASLKLMEEVAKSWT
jgi:transcriptional regulator with XRE-family HTH domain